MAGGRGGSVSLSVPACVRIHSPPVGSVPLEKVHTPDMVSRSVGPAHCPPAHALLLVLNTPSRFLLPGLGTGCCGLLCPLPRRFHPDLSTDSFRNRPSCPGSVDTSRSFTVPWRDCRLREGVLLVLHACAQHRNACCENEDFRKQPPWAGYDQRWELRLQDAEQFAQGHTADEASARGGQSRPQAVLVSGGFGLPRAGLPPRPCPTHTHWLGSTEEIRTPDAQTSRDQ